MSFKRRKSIPVRCGDLIIGGDAPIWVQTMTKCDTRDIEATVEQIRRACARGADIVRVAVPDEEAARSLSRIKKSVKCPLVADIHFDYKLALMSIDAGVDKIRINPGNIGGKERLLEVARKAREYGCAIRLGVNSGSVEKDLLEKYSGPSPLAMVESALRHVRYLEDEGFSSIVISLKSSSVKDTIAAYELMAQKTDWPFHVGITEAGYGQAAIVKSSVGIGTLLALGIGDTIRVSLTGPLEDEVDAGKHILESLDLRRFGPDIISCPTCGRTQVDLLSIVEEVRKRLENLSAPIKVAVMGCPVNGPGEAREADLGVACGRGGGVLFLKGQVIGTVRSDEIVDKVVALANQVANKMDVRRESF